jgi:quercetin dioxygenase-like cupin family protein
MNKTEISKLVEYSENGPMKKVFYDKGNIKAQIMCLKAGQTIPPCKMNHDVLFYVIKGKGYIFVDDEKEELFEGTAVVVPKEAKTRSIKSDEDMIILGVQGIYDRK